MGKVCTFFGHRDAPSSVIPQLKEKIIYLIEHEGVDIFMLGNKGNFDKYASRVLHGLKDDFPHIVILLVAAYVDELHKENGIGYFDVFDYPPEIQCVPKRFALSARNRYLATYCHYVIVYVNHTWGGAYQAMKFAERQNKTVINLTELYLPVFELQQNGDADAGGDNNRCPNCHQLR